MSSFAVAFTLSCLFAYSAAMAAIPYDKLTLAESWPQTACYSLNQKWPQNGETPTCSPCIMPQTRNRWTLHGLWPSNTRGVHPSFCNRRLGYDRNQMSARQRENMEQKWTSFRLGGNNDGFWGHEWNKHGTCALDISSTNTQTKYFDKSLEMVDQYNLATILQQGGIYANRAYDFENVADAIRRNFGVNPFISCSTNPNNGVQYLGEVQVCFDKSFQRINCAPEVGTNCDRSKTVYYPTNLPTC